MSLPINEAEKILIARLGAPAKPPTKYIIGFKTASGKVLAMHREIAATQIWFQAPAPPSIEGVRLLDDPNNGNSNINGPLLPLRAPSTLRAEIDSQAALNRFLDWYAGTSNRQQAVRDAGDHVPRAFEHAFKRFQALVLAKSGFPFNGFDEGLVAAWEDYKPRLREFALGLLSIESWTENEIGSGAILNRMINAIEIQDARTNNLNNLVFWQNRYGHANRDHRVFLEAATNPKLRREIETVLYSLFKSDDNEGGIFDKLSSLVGGKYPLLAYIFFLKDIDRFMPIQPTGFDRAFRELDVDFIVLGQCNWENYQAYNAILTNLRPMIQLASGLKSVRLIDAHSFCWVLTTLIKQETEGTIVSVSGKSSDGRVLGGREKSIIALRMSVENTVKNANGQVVERILKNKELRMTPMELEKHIAALLDRQENRCALTGIPFVFHGSDVDKNLLPSLDRIDSAGHYEAGNLQVVCQFINFWKSDSDNSEFKRLLMLVRGLE